MGAVDDAWQRMKDEARKTALEGRAITRLQAQALVTRLFHECFVSPMPDPDTIAFLGREFLRMIAEHNPEAAAR